MGTETRPGRLPIHEGVPTDGGTSGGLDLLADVLGRLPGIILDARPRMADYARILAAVDAVRGTAALPRYLAQRGELQREAAEGDRVGALLLAWAADRLPWTGTASELLEALTPDRPPRDWPATGRALSGNLRRLAQPLTSAGIAVTFERSGHNRARLVYLEADLIRARASLTTRPPRSRRPLSPYDARKVREAADLEARIAELRARTLAPIRPAGA